MNRGRHTSRNVSFVMPIINRFMNYIPNNFYKNEHPSHDGWRIEASYTANNFRTTKLCTPIHSTIFRAVKHIEQYLRETGIQKNTQICIKLKQDYFCKSTIYMKWKD